MSDIKLYDHSNETLKLVPHHGGGYGGLAKLFSSRLTAALAIEKDNRKSPDRFLYILNPFLKYLCYFFVMLCAYVSCYEFKPTPLFISLLEEPPYHFRLIAILCGNCLLGDSFCVL